MTVLEDQPDPPITNYDWADASEMKIDKLYEMIRALGKDAKMSTKARNQFSLASAEFVNIKNHMTINAVPTPGQSSG